MTGIVKSFGSVQALRGADFTSWPGAVHAILGENGAGKSTLMHVLYGLITPDAGAVELAGRPVLFGSARAAIEAGVGMVHQHFTQVPAMTVAENVALGLPGFRYDARRAAAAVQAIGEATGLHLDPSARVAGLPIGLRQRLEIVKALAREARVLVLDEPTAALVPAEVDELFVALRRLAGRGTAIVLITHKLREVAAIADAVTVLRRGQSILTGPAGDFTAGTLAEAMVGAAGRRVVSEALEERAEDALGAPVPVLLEVHGLQVGRGPARAVRDAAFTIGAGEIVGVAAVEGNGQRELLRAIAEVGPRSGEVRLRGPGGIGFIPEDRHREGLILDFDIGENLALGGPLPFWLDREVMDGHAVIAIDEFGIRTPGPRVPVAQLSGGNQQKVVLARVLAHRPALLIAENPTRGLDLQATAEVHERLLRAAHRDGAAVLFHSTDLDEVLALADRVAVMVGGHWSWVPDDRRSREQVGALMLGAA